MASRIVLLPSVYLGGHAWQGTAERLREAGAQVSVADPGTTFDPQAIAANYRRSCSDDPHVIVAHSNAALYLPSLLLGARVPRGSSSMRPSRRRTEPSRSHRPRCSPRWWRLGAHAYLAFQESFGEQIEEAERLGWATRMLPGTHLHMVNDPRATADVLLDLVDEIHQRKGR